MNAPAQTNTKSGGSWLSKVIFGLIFTIFFVLFVFIFGSVQGEEFNPYTFQRQRFYFVQIPFLRIQVWPTKYKNTTSATCVKIAGVLGKRIDAGFDVEDYTEVDPVEDDEDSESPAVVAGGTFTNTGPTRWDLVESQRLAAKPWHGDSKLLCDSLDIVDHKRAEVWNSWTMKHPKAAKVLWPIVAEVAQANQYVLVPDLLEIAASETSYTSPASPAVDTTALKKKLVDVVTRESQKLGDANAANKNHQRALQAYQLVLANDPSSLPAKKGAADARYAIESDPKLRDKAPLADSDPNSDDRQKSSEQKTPAAEVDDAFDSDEI